MNRQIDKKITKQVRIDKGLHTLLKMESAKQEKTIGELVEDCIVAVLSPNLMENSKELNE